MRLGGSQGVPVDARIVAATNRDLETMVAAGTFREDLYYRVNVVRIHLPPLRERPGDAVALALHFVESLAPTLGRKGAKLSLDALELISSYPFPGNVRELSNAVERALILADGDELHARDFQLGAGKRQQEAKSITPTGGTGSNTEMGSMPDSRPRSLAEVEKLAILAALAHNEGKREATAIELGITRRTLLNKLNEYGYSD